MTDFLFQSRIFPSSWTMHLAMADEYLSAGGANDCSSMLKALDIATDAELADEAMTNWELGDNDDFDINELIEAYADIRENFDARFPPDEEAA